MKNVETFYPLTPMQQGLLFHTLYAPESGVYVEQMSCTLHGDLNVEAFRHAWERVVARHPALRTSFLTEGVPEPVQVVHRQVPLGWTEEDWRGVHSSELPARLEDYLRSERERGFELSRPPLLRFALLRLSEDAYRFVWCWHHLLLDGWSLPLLLGEVFSLYGGGSEAALPARRPYREFVAWARGRGAAGAERYWREALRGFAEPTSLRALERRNGAGVESLGEVLLRVGEAESAALVQAARRRGVTLNAAAQAAWALALARLSEHDDVLFGAVVSGRGGGLPGVAEMVGLMINTLPVRARVARRDEGAWEWAARLQEEQAEAREYEQVGLVEVQGWSEVGRGASLFESLLAFENYPVDDSVQEMRLGFEIEDIKTSTQTNYPLTLTVVPSSDILLRLAYDASRFNEPAVNELLEEFRAVLRLLAARADVTLSELNRLLDEQKRERRAAAEEVLKRTRGLKFKTVRRAAVTAEAARAAESSTED